MHWAHGPAKTQGGQPRVGFGDPYEGDPRGDPCTNGRGATLLPGLLAVFPLRLPSVKRVVVGAENDCG